MEVPRELDDKLKFMSPNERDAFVQKILKQKQQERIKLARKEFSNFTRERRQKYVNDKKNMEEISKRIQSEDVIEAKEMIIEDLRKRIDHHYKNMGYGMNGADENEEDQRILAKSKRILEAQRRIDMEERYDEAVKYFKKCSPKVAIEERRKAITSAKNIANSRSSERVSRFSHEKLMEQKRQDEMKKAYDDEMKNLMHPRLSVKDYANTRIHAGIGVIPMNNEALEYQKLLEDKEKEEEELEKKRYISRRQRTHEAAKVREFENDLARLNKELENIRKYETDEQLEAINNGTSMVHTQYCVEEKRQHRQEAMKNRWLTADDEPKPRELTPQPEPFAIDYF